MRSISLLSWSTSSGADCGRWRPHRCRWRTLGQLVHAVEHVVDLGEGALGGLHQGDTVLGVVLGLVQAGDLARIFSEMARPAASSPARLIL
mgnify:CR=1 FL=1